MSEANVGLIGDPVAHSISPQIHNAAFAHLQIAARYEAWHTPASALRTRVERLRAPGMLGANVTLPHKLAVIALLDRIDPLATMIGAVNTIVRAADGTLEGYNTDAPALLDSLRDDAGFQPAGQNVVLLGASGAARAACAVFVQAGVAQLLIVNRTLERAEELLADIMEHELLAAEAEERAPRDLPAMIALAPDDPQLPELMADTSLIVNATSLGWHGSASPLVAELIPQQALVFDMVYRPTPLLRAAERCGARTLDGLGMLVRQAALAFEHWTGQPAPLEVMWKAARAAINE